MVDTDVLVIGGGLAGLVAAQRIRRPEAAAALTARVTVLEGERPGGLLNWGGRNAFHIAGPRYKFSADDLGTLIEDARQLGVELVAESVVRAELAGPVKTIETSTGRVIRAHAVIIACGAFPLKNAARFKRKDGLVTTFGTATAIQTTVARLMQKTGRSRLLLMGSSTILDLAELIADLNPQVLVDPPHAGPLPPGAQLGSLERIVGAPRIEGVEYRDPSGELRRLDCDTIYADFNAYMERTTATRFLQSSGLALEHGFVVTDRALATSLPGVFAAGDVTGGMFAVSKALYEGNRAGFSALTYFHRSQFGFEPGLHPFFYGPFATEVGVFRVRPGVRLTIDESEGPVLLVETSAQTSRYGLTPELVALLRAVIAQPGPFHVGGLGVPVEGLGMSVLFELVRVGALGVGWR